MGTWGKGRDGRRALRRLSDIKAWSFRRERCALDKINQIDVLCWDSMSVGKARVDKLKQS